MEEGLIILLESSEMRKHTKLKKLQKNFGNPKISNIPVTNNFKMSIQMVKDTDCKEIRRLWRVGPNKKRICYSKSKRKSLQKTKCDRV